MWNVTSKKWGEMCWILGFHHSTPFLRKNFLVAKFRILIYKKAYHISAIRAFFKPTLWLSQKKIILETAANSQRWKRNGLSYPFPRLLILNLELQSNSMRGSRMSDTGAGFMIWGYNLNSSHSSEELIILKRNKGRGFLNLCMQRGRPEGQTSVTSGEGGGLTLAGS